MRTNLLESRLQAARDRYRAKLSAAQSASAQPFSGEENGAESCEGPLHVLSEDGLLVRLPTAKEAWALARKIPGLRHAPASKSPARAAAKRAAAVAGRLRAASVMSGNGITPVPGGRGASGGAPLPPALGAGRGAAGAPDPRSPASVFLLSSTSSAVTLASTASGQRAGCQRSSTLFGARDSAPPVGLGGGVDPSGPEALLAPRAALELAALAAESAAAKDAEARLVTRPNAVSTGASRMNASLLALLPACGVMQRDPAADAAAEVKRCREVAQEEFAVAAEKADRAAVAMIEGRKRKQRARREAIAAAAAAGGQEAAASLNRLPPSATAAISCAGTGSAGGAGGTGVGERRGHGTRAAAFDRLSKLPPHKAALAPPPDPTRLARQAATPSGATTEAADMDNTADASAGSAGLLSEFIRKANLATPQHMMGTTPVPRASYETFRTGAGRPLSADEIAELAADELTGIRRLPSAAMRYRALRSSPVARRAFIHMVEADGRNERKLRARRRAEFHERHTTTMQSLAVAFTEGRGVPGGGIGGPDDSEYSSDEHDIRRPCRPATCPPGSSPAVVGASLVSPLDAPDMSHPRGIEAAVRLGRREQQRRRQLEARDRRAMMATWRTARTLDKLQRPDFVRMRREAAASLELRLHTWATATVAARAMQVMVDRMVATLRFSRRLDVVRRLKLEVHGLPLAGGADRRAEIMKRDAAWRIWISWRLNRQNYKRAIRDRTAPVVRHLLERLGIATAVTLAVRKIIRCVVMLQRARRGALVCREERTRLWRRQLGRYVERVGREEAAELEDLCRRGADEQRRKSSVAPGAMVHRRSTNFGAGSAGSGPMGRRSRAEAEASQTRKVRVEFIQRRRRAAEDFTPEVLGHVVNTIIAERTAAYREECGAYGRAVDEFLSLIGLPFCRPRSSKAAPSKAVNAAVEATKARRRYRAFLAAEASGAAEFEECPLPRRPRRPRFHWLMTLTELSRAVYLAIEDVETARSAGPGTFITQ